MLGTTKLLLLLLYLAFVFMAWQRGGTRKKIKGEKKQTNKNSEKERGGKKEEEIRRIK